MKRERESEREAVLLHEGSEITGGEEDEERRHVGYPISSSSPLSVNKNGAREAPQHSLLPVVGFDCRAGSAFVGFIVALLGRILLTHTYHRPYFVTYEVLETYQGCILRGSF